MSYKEILIDSQKSGVSAMLEFVLQYREFNKVVACFVEGKDSSYYRSRVKDIVNADFEVLFYPCNGKKEVESVKMMIDSNLHLSENIKTLYFCDSDYGIDDKLNGIFYTDYYSVENYYANIFFVKKIINDIFNINKYNPDYEICLDLYNERYNRFNEQIVKLNAYCYGLRVKEKKLLIPRTKLDNIKLSDILKNKDFINYEFKSLDYKTIKSMIISDNIISNQEYNECLKNIDYTKYRGKWELMFTIWFLEELRMQIKKGGCGLSMNNRIKFSFDNDIMTSTERFAITTDNLVRYINDFFNQ